ncbi:ABC transporter ATP-binding protein [Flavobacterium daejeonense]|uniref:ABC transporter ATP-binding protein n=1 Tax=Flavobacterium daejeonense TaxID=350893 RepID=UPI00047ED9D8|nr:ABC transporter ATP-binding protein [Flavobacterium daejeonense]
MKEIIIKAENISKQYRLGKVGTGTIKHDLNRWWHSLIGKEDPYLKIGEANDRSVKGESDYVWALQDINFEIAKGEVVGIIGKNGAGKSTLLKILSRVTSPTTGSVKFGGRVASLLEVGTGFNGEMTGRENIFLNGAILGMTKKEIASKLDEIIEFSGCERYIDTPVKRYSSGMYVRLAFAVAAFLEPEILIVDEVLAVGDAEFQKKAIGKMQDISKGEGRTVLFVSHNMAAVKSLCTRGIVLEHGKVAFEGGIDEALNRYLSSKFTQMVWKGIDGDETLSLMSVSINNFSRDSNLKTSDSLQILLQFKLGIVLNDIVLGFSVLSGIANPLVGVLYNDYNDYTVINPGEYEVSFIIPPYSLASGDYEIEFNLSIHNVKKFTTQKSNLTFNLLADSEVGNKFFLQNHPNYNSVVRPNWFEYLKKNR